MNVYEAPGKLNLSLLVQPPRSDGLHPLDSLVQTIEWCDVLEVELGEDGRDHLESDIEGNLVTKALALSREFGNVPPLDLRLEKNLPVAAGLGGGSSDAAAALLAAHDFGQVAHVDLPAVASRVGADVPLFLTGGTVLMSGVGEEIDVVRRAEGFAVAIVVPDFGLSTSDVYRRWDEMEGPTGEEAPEAGLPPSLRGRMPMRNDLLPAAIDVEPLLGDFMADVRAEWAGSVFLTGSGSACFGYFATLDEAADAADSVSHVARTTHAASLRPHGVAALPPDVE